MNTALIRLLHLASPTLPVGAYTYSQGLEWAVETGAVRNEDTALAWIGDCLAFGVARFEAVYLAHMLAAWGSRDTARLAELDAEFIASRESSELRAETLQMGHSLTRLLTDLADFPAAPLADFSAPSFPLAWSCAAAAWSIPAPDAIGGYLWAWAENQVMAAVKAVPLGQTAGQRMLLALGQRIPTLAEDAAACPIEATHNVLPAFAIASSRHETQYTRLFRS
ncbi:MAG: urease accessory protein UreF [Hydrogenophilales bacterium]|nr:urease accessory protein UreF [Hydrogenophilales bacterium]